MSEPVILSREQVRAVDRRAIEQLGIPGLVLMENAAINAAAILRHLLKGRAGQGGERPRVAIICGGGNNGGDGYAIARHLHNGGLSVELFAAKAPDQLKGDAATNHAICANMRLAITRVDEPGLVDAAAWAWAKADLIVDAMLGTGFSGEVRQPLASIIQRVNALDGPLVVAIDTPSGLDCQSGAPASATVEAGHTITFVAQKVGFTAAGAERYTGQVHVADIGAPPELIEAVQRERL
jgi:NAD(P)H-hydrate epimerase